MPIIEDLIGLYYQDSKSLRLPFVDELLFVNPDNRLFSKSLLYLLMFAHIKKKSQTVLQLNMLYYSYLWAQYRVKVVNFVVEKKSMQFLVIILVFLKKLNLFFF